MAPNDEILQTLLTRLEFDEASANEVARAVQEAEVRSRQIAEAERTLEGDSFAASQRLKLEEQESSFQAMEEALRRHYSKRIDTVREGSEEERRLLHERDEDLKMLQERRKEFSADMEQDQGMFQKLGATASDALGGLGLGGMMNIAGVAGAIAMAKEAVDALRESRTRGRGVAARAGMDISTRGATISGFLDTFSRATDISEEELSRIATPFAPMVRSGEEGEQSLTKWLSQATLLGTSTGMGSEGMAKLMSQLHMQGGVATGQLPEAIADISAAAKSVGIPMTEFGGWVSRATEQGKLYNTSVFETTSLVKLFSNELKEGTISIQQIVAMQTAVAKAPEGAQALLGQTVLEGGGQLAEEMRAAGATTPFLAGGMARAIGEGALLTGGKLIGGADQSKAQKVQAEAQRETLERIMVASIDDATQKSFAGLEKGSGAWTYARGVMGKQMYQTPGETVVQRDKAIDTIGKDFSGSVKQFLDGTTRYKTAAERMFEATESLRKSIGMTERVWDTIKLGSMDFVSMAQESAARERGDTEEANKIRAQREKRWGTGEETGYDPALTGGFLATMGMAPFTALFAAGKGYSATAAKGMGEEEGLAGFGRLLANAISSALKSQPIVIRNATGIPLSVDREIGEDGPRNPVVPGGVK